MDPNPRLLSSPSRARSQPAELCMEGRRNPSPCEQGRDSSFSWNQVPDPDWFWDEQVQAKRARVETIIRGMCLSPDPLVPGSVRARDSPSCPEKARERKRKQSLPLQQNPPKPGPAGTHGRKGGPHVREQLHMLKQQLRQRQGHVPQAAAPGDSAPGAHGAKQRNGYGRWPWTVDSDRQQGSGGDLSGVEKHRVAEVEYQPEEPGSLSSGARALLEILRKELTGAVSQAVDSVLQKVLLDPPGHLAPLGRSFQELVPGSSSETSPEGGACEDPLPLAALPRSAQAPAGGPARNVALAKPLDSPRYPVSLRTISKPCQGPPAKCPLTVPPHMQENQTLSQLLGHGSTGHWSGRLPQDVSSRSHSPSESAPRPWGAVKLRPLVLSQQQHPVPFPATRLGKLPFLPSVKMEQGGLQAVTDLLPFASAHISFPSRRQSHCHSPWEQSLEGGEVETNGYIA